MMSVLDEKCKKEGSIVEHFSKISKNFNVTSSLRMLVSQKQIRFLEAKL